VDTVRPRTIPYLALDELIPNPRLAQRLPAVLAWRFHALPLAEDQGRVTVAMANPDDPAAREAIAGALGATSCMVQGDPATIDALLAEIWGSESNPVTMAICAFPSPISEVARTYGQSLAALLAARLIYLDTADHLDRLTRGQEGLDPAVYLFEEPDHPLLRNLLTKGTGSNPIQERATVPPAVLLAKGPRWPIKKILFILCGNDRGQPAVDWVLRFARRSESAVTVLTIVPPTPAMYGHRAAGDSGLPALLTTETSLGRQMRQVAQQLVGWGIDGTLRLRQGPPDLQIYREVAESDCDLIAVSARPCHWLLRWLGSDLVNFLLHWSDRPVLVVNSTAP
jgi:nucleotide-binding universal stress UspA family protein